MPITGFRNSTQPASTSINTAYRPIVFYPQLNTTTGPFPPVVYCDVYVNGSFYKTLTSTSYIQTSVLTSPYWVFDVQNVLQELLRSNLPVLTGITVAATLQDILGSGASVSVFCKFRVSTLDTNGFITPEGAPGSGGYTSNTFYVINSVLQHEDNQDLKAHLVSYRKGGPVTTPNDIVPLSHRPDGYVICTGDYDHFPFFPIATAFPIPALNYLLGISYKIPGAGSPTLAYTKYNYSITQNIPATLPAGIVQLRQLTWYDSLSPDVVATIDFDAIVEYSLFLTYSSGGGPMGSPSFYTPLFKTKGCNCCSGHYRVRFLNYLGFYDCINFDEVTGTLVTSSDQWQKALKYPLVKADGGFRRFNVRTNENYTATTYAYGEEMQEWLKELYDTPEAYLELPAAQGQPLSQVPILIKDGESTWKKIDGRYTYVTEIKFEMSNENIRQRN